MTKHICVYSSSSDAIDKSFFKIAEELGKSLGQYKSTLIYGGATVGLMGVIARNTINAGGKVIGIIPDLMQDKGITFKDATELIIAADIKERKALMIERSEAFIALPGGFGTLDEILEVLTLKQLGIINQPLVFLNINDCFSPLLSQFQYFYDNKFAKVSFKNNYFITDNVREAMEYIMKYEPIPAENKWF